MYRLRATGINVVSISSIIPADMLVAPLMIMALLSDAQSAAGKSVSVDDVFASYCSLSDHQPYCREPAPGNIKWLVLHSLCSSESPKTNDAYRAICRDLTKVKPDVRRFLAYRPQLDRWSAVKFVVDKNGQYQRQTDDASVDIDETGVATVTRSASDDIPILIEGVNPLIYTTTPDSVTSDDVDSLAALQDLAAGLGAAFQEAASIYGNVKAGHGFAAPKDQEPASLITVVNLYNKQYRDLGAASANIADRAALVAISRAEAIASIQDVERLVNASRGMLAVSTRRLWPQESVDGLALDASLDGLETAYKTVASFGSGCRPLLKTFSNVLAHVDDTESQLALQIDAFVQEFAPDARCTGLFQPLAEDIKAEALALCTAAKADATGVDCAGRPPGTAGTFAGLIKSAKTKYSTGVALLVTPPSGNGQGAHAARYRAGSPHVEANGQSQDVCRAPGGSGSQGRVLIR